MSSSSSLDKATEKTEPHQKQRLRFTPLSKTTDSKSTNTKRKKDPKLKTQEQKNKTLLLRDRFGKIMTFELPDFAYNPYDLQEDRLIPFFNKETANYCAQHLFNFSKFSKLDCKLI